MSEKFEPKSSSEPTETDTPKSFTLSRGEEKIVVSSAEEATQALYGGFSPETFDGVRGLCRDFGVDVSKIQRELEVKRLEGRFNENNNRELFYLSDGLEVWFENVNNYWYNYGKKQGGEYAEMEKNLVGLEKQMLENIKRGMGLVQHQDTKDIKAKSIVIERFNKDVNVPESYKIDLDEFKDQVVYEMEYRTSGKIFWPDKKLPERLQPKDTSVKDYHPLLKPFKEVLVQLTKEGVTELPDWLKQQGEMAGLSSVYQNIPIQLNTWLEKAQKTRDEYDLYASESSINDKPYLSLPITYAEDLAIIDRKIHRRNK
jgi:hypothetical protein